MILDYCQSFLVTKRAIFYPTNIEQGSFGYAIMFSFHLNNWKLYKHKPYVNGNLVKYKMHKKYLVLLENISAFEKKQLNIRIKIFTLNDSASLKR